ncbi:MAG: lipoyl(octanoyl) transferase LipB [Anaerolineae bacterium]
MSLASFTPNQVYVCKLGRQPYQPVEELQKELVALRQQNVIPDVLLLLEHEPVFTLGRRADPAHILARPETLEREGIAVCRTERGGDVTYHGPGQLVAYPILYLPNTALGPSDYMHRLEDVAAALAADFGVQTHRREGVIGVWVGYNKLAALGVRIKGGVCYHGIAFNVAPNMFHWSLIIPCGITDGGVTSLAAELDCAPGMDTVEDHFIARFGELFKREMVLSSIQEIRAFNTGS